MKSFFCRPDISENTFTRLTKNLDNFDEPVKNPSHHLVLKTFTIILFVLNSNISSQFLIDIYTVMVHLRSINCFYFTVNTFVIFVQYPIEAFPIISVGLLSIHPMVFSSPVYPDIRIGERALFSLFISSYLSTAVLQTKQSSKKTIYWL